MSSEALRRLPALDALRAVGAAAVVGTHVGFATGATFQPVWGGVLARLDVGVAIFFVLSGFLLFRPHAHAAATGAPRPGTGRYLWRRALRILPAYWLTVAACLLLLPGNADATRADWLRHVTLTQIYQPHHLREALGHTWSLATEAAFYLLLPLLAVLVLPHRRWRPSWTVTVLCLGGALVTGGWLAAMAAGWLDMGLHTMWLPSFATWFAAGMALATVHVAVSQGRWTRFADVGRAPLTCWALAAGLLLIASTPLTGPRDLAEPTAGEFGARMVLFLGVAVAVVAPVAFVSAGPVRSALSGPVARWLGLVSYGLFLWHPLVLTVLPPRGFAVTYALTVAGALILASLSWYLLEKPLQFLGHPRRARARAKARAA